MPSESKRTTNDSGRKLKYDEMVTLSILALKDRNGSSSYAISKYMKENFPIASDTVLKVQLRNAIKRMEEDGRIVRNKASFKLTPEAKAQFLKKTGKTSETKKKELTKKAESTKKTQSTKKAEPKKTAAKQTRVKKSTSSDKSKTRPRSSSTSKKATESKKTSVKKTRAESTKKKSK